MRMGYSDELDSRIDKGWNHLPIARTVASALGVDPWQE